MSVTPQFMSPGVDITFLLVRALFGTVLAFTELNHSLNLDHMTGYAKMRGLPAPHLDVIVSGGMLVSGGLGTVLGVFPTLVVGVVAIFLVVGTLVFYDLWAVLEDQREFEMTGFLENLVMPGGALVSLAPSGTTWPYVISPTLF